MYSVSKKFLLICGTCNNIIYGLFAVYCKFLHILNDFTEILWHKNKMKNLKLFDSLRTLNKEEFREFGKFVHSPYCNNRSEAVRFYDEIKPFYPDFDSEKLESKNLFKLIYPGKKFNPVLIRKTQSLLFHLFQKYIVDLKFRNNRLLYDLELIEALRDRKLVKLHNKKYREYEDNLKGLKETMEVYEFIYKSENVLRLNYESLDKEIEKSRRSLNKMFPYIFTLMLNEYLYIINLHSDYEKIIDKDLFNIMMAYLEKSVYRKYPLINYYYLMVKLKITGEIRYFNELFEFRNVHSKKLETVHNENALIILIDYCLINIGTGKYDFRETMFKLSQVFAEENIMYQKVTEPITFTNLIRNSAALKQFHWAEKFMLSSENNLPLSEKSSIINYCKGMLEYEKGNYQNALKLLSPLNLKWLNMKNDIRKIMIKCYYELAYFEELLLQIDSYRHFINTNYDPKQKSFRGNRNFIKYVSLLINLTMNNDSRTAAELMNRIEKTEYFYHKEWVQEKLYKIIKKGAK